MGRPRVAIVFGGRSEEHDVSVKSAIEIAGNIDTQRYEPIYVGITRSGAWKICERPSTDWERGSCRPAVISPDTDVHGLLVVDGGEHRPLRVDAVFPVLHGRYGEDGAVHRSVDLHA